MKSRTCNVRTYCEVVIGERTYEVGFDRITTYSHDPNADCDADGNRGHAVDYIDEDRANVITATVDDGKEIVSFVSLHADVRAQVKKAVDDYLEKHDPEPTEEDDGPDWDAINDMRRDREMEDREAGRYDREDN